MNKFTTATQVTGRILISLIFLLSGISKIGSYEGMQGYMDMMGVPSVLLPLVIVTEIFGALALILGFKTQIAAFLLAGFSVVSALLFHFDLADQMQFIMFMKNIAIAGGLLFLVANGAGTLSLDHKLQARNS